METLGKPLSSGLHSGNSEAGITGFLKEVAPLHFPEVHRAQSSFAPNPAYGVIIAANIGATEWRIPSRSSISVGRRRVLPSLASISLKRGEKPAASSGLMRTTALIKARSRTCFCSPSIGCGSPAEVAMKQQSAFPCSVQPVRWSVLNVCRSNAKTAVGFPLNKPSGEIPGGQRT
jgi:hypothetical protein